MMTQVRMEATHRCAFIWQAELGVAAPIAPAAAAAPAPAFGAFRGRQVGAMKEMTSNSAAPFPFILNALNERRNMIYE